MPEPVLATHQASLVFGQGSAATRALDRVDLTIAPQEMTVVTGPSGSGKTSLLCVLGCVLQPTSGSVRILGQEVTHLDEEERSTVRRECLTFVFQTFRLFRSLTALENVALPLDLGGLRTAQARRTARQVLEDVGLGQRLNTGVESLSGGEKQRVAIARALALRKPLLLADEPTAALDSRNGASIRRLLRKVVDEHRLTVVVVSHDLRFCELAETVLELKDGWLVQ